MKFFVWLMLCFYGWEQNEYFGWNAFPQSQAELMADGISCLMFMLVIIYFKLCEGVEP